MSNLVEYAKSEMRLLGYTGEEPEDDPNRWMWNNIIDVVETFSAGGHSGMSAMYTIDIIEKILRYEPLTPLTFADDEWIKHNQESYPEGIPTMWQNKRKTTVFSADEGKTWYDLNEEGTPRHPIMMETNS